MPSVDANMGDWDSSCTVRIQTGADILEANVEILGEIGARYPMTQHFRS